MQHFWFDTVFLQLSVVELSWLSESRLKDILKDCHTNMN